MNSLMDLPGRVLRAAFSLVFGLALLVFTLSLLAAALLGVVGLSLWALLSGRKPAPVMVFQRFRQRSQRYTSGVWPGRGPAAPAQGAADVVDVQAREVSGTPAPGVEPLRRVWP